MTTDNLSATDFPAFFTSLWGKEMTPFQWQTDLAKRVLESNENKDAAPTGPVANRKPWPAAIGLPTASGKTACMDIAVFALAVQASRLAESRPITAPRRIFFVVDRRIIVDEAFERARRLARHLDSAKEGTLKAVADALRIVAHGQTAGFEGEQPLVVQALRGGTHRSEAWVHNPLQPTIVATTVDQIGSRLLFRGYGRRSGVWPILAGLVANDSLILLDEAHCAQPFLQTLQAVQLYQEDKWAERPLRRPFQPVVMSATPPASIADVFRDESDQPSDPEHPLGRRQMAQKPARLKEIAAKGDHDKQRAALPQELRQSALAMVNGQRQAIVVFANRVSTARDTYRLLQRESEVESVLLTGRMRPIDKDRVVQELYSKQISANASHDRILEKPIIVVATQTLEVGADLDFDGLVTECASLDALRQRFGRLNRMGRPISARAEILICPAQAKPKRGQPDDPVYGAALPATWNWLNKCKRDDDTVDFGIVALERLLKANDPKDDLSAPALDAPVMLPAHIDCWAQTAPQPRPSPDVTHFLHGPREGRPDVNVCWRADIDLAADEGPEQALDSLRRCPPCSSEALPVPLFLFRRWLAGDQVADHSSDVEGAQDPLQNQSGANAPSSPNRLAVVRWLGRNTHIKNDIISDPDAIEPGDMIVIPTSHPGNHYELGDLPHEWIESPDELDVGDRAHRLARAKPILRLHRRLVELWPKSVAAKETALDLLNNLDRQFEEEPDEFNQAVRDLLQELGRTADIGDRWSWLPQAARELDDELSGSAKLRRQVQLAENQGLVVVGTKRISQDTPCNERPFSDEDDSTASGFSHRDGRPVRLCDHLPGVKEFAHRHAVGCGLPRDIADAVALSGLLHDLGKVDPRFQAWLNGGLPWRTDTSEALAKSAQMPQSRAAQDSARRASGYPRGGRHELLSVRLAESAPELLPEDENLRDLVLHLVASHHGHCRPFAPVVFDDDAPQVEYQLEGHHMIWCGPTGLERLDSGIAERYWRLTRRYGWWGLAWLEALLRLADWRRSEWEEANDAEE